MLVTGKHQRTNHKSQTNNNYQKTNERNLVETQDFASLQEYCNGLEFWAWCFGFICYLVLEIWNFNFGGLQCH